MYEPKMTWVWNRMMSMPILGMSRDKRYMIAYDGLLEGIVYDMQTGDYSFFTIFTRPQHAEDCDPSELFSLGSGFLWTDNQAAVPFIYGMLKEHFPVRYGVLLDQVQHAEYEAMLAAQSVSSANLTEHSD